MLWLLGGPNQPKYRFIVPKVAGEVPFIVKNSALQAGMLMLETCFATYTNLHAAAPV